MDRLPESHLQLTIALTMWILPLRTFRPDLVVWRGRKVLAALDAVVWPSLLGVALLHLSMDTGLVEPVVLAIVMLCGAVRLHRALWANARYRFTTWRVGKLAAFLLLTGWVLKATMVH